MVNDNLEPCRPAVEVLVQNIECIFESKNEVAVCPHSTRTRELFSAISLSIHYTHFLLRWKPCSAISGLDSRCSGNGGGADLTDMDVLKQESSQSTHNYCLQTDCSVSTPYKSCSDYVGLFG